MTTETFKHRMIFRRSQPKMTEYWLISAPGDKTCQQTWETMNNLTSKQNNLSINYKFHIPDLKVSRTYIICLQRRSSDDFLLGRHFGSIGRSIGWFGETRRIRGANNSKGGRLPRRGPRGPKGQAARKPDGEQQYVAISDLSWYMGMLLRLSIIYAWTFAFQCVRGFKSLRQGAHFIAVWP